MSKWKKIVAAIIVLEFCIVAICNVICMQQFHNQEGRLYRVEAKRAAEEIQANGLESVELENYQSLVNITEYDPKHVIPNDYLIEEVDGTLYCIEYYTIDNKSFMGYMNAAFALFILLTSVILFYVQNKMIAPFRRMQHLSEELAKGNLAVPVKEEKSKFFGRFLWGMDMLRENLEEKKQKELELQKEKKTLILSLSHDIKTPLLAIKLYVKALADGLYDTEERRKEALEGIRKNTEEIASYVNEITQASREDFLKLEVNNGELYLYEVLDQIKAYYTEKLSVLHTDFVLQDVANCLICGNKDRLVEVMQNVIENAIKYGDGKRIAIHFADEEDCKLITVVNTGKIPEEDEIPHLFDSFYRGSNHGNTPGSGLGLYICKQLMHKMDGDVFVKTKEDTFSVTMVIKKA